MNPTSDFKKNESKHPTKSGGNSDKANGDKKKSYRRSWRSASPIKKVEIIIAGLAAAVGLGYLSVYIWSTSQAKRNFEAENRPRIVITKYEVMDEITYHRKEPQTFEVGKPLYVNVDIQNIGKTTAFNFFPHYHVVFGKGVSQIRVEPMETTSHEVTIDAGAIGAVTAVSLIDPYVRESVVLDPREVLPWDGSEPIIVFGRMTYEDTSGNVYCTPILVRHTTQNWANMANVNDITSKDLCPKGER